MNINNLGPGTLVTIEAFGRTFENILPGAAQDLRTLEKEGAIYVDDNDLDEEGNIARNGSRFRVKLSPSEIFEYVEASIVQQEYVRLLDRGLGHTEAIKRLFSPKYRNRLLEYDEFLAKEDPELAADMRGCFASFIGPELEDLLCGMPDDRYERIPFLGNEVNQSEIVLKTLRSIPTSIRKLHRRSNKRPPFLIENEYDVQDLIEIVLRGLHPEVIREEWTPKSAGSAKRIDLAIRHLGVMIECKYVRSSGHSKKLADELKIDFESYHNHQDCRHLFVYIHDPNQYISDPENFASDLNGIRRKRDHEFSVEIFIG
ncbi:hypothetical protein E1293_43085 [Actinomadura darangshiensis]|uniref:Uncharacterized protein n=1 Tax=Actinomadura darangshiensis TaxID=705336 RepID=A0A4R5A246_9ACTN|nr:hypothetical protein [Actinomadura darangshiensis]TDD63532.1 hypothetical protein E1293_43085 [Actinomadura darangshiensis]